MLDLSKSRHEVQKIPHGVIPGQLRETQTAVSEQRLTIGQHHRGRRRGATVSFPS